MIDIIHIRRILGPGARGASAQRVKARSGRAGVSRRLAGLLMTLLVSGCKTQSHLSFLDPQGPIAAAQRWHFFEVMAVLTIFVALPIFVLTPWWAWRYRYGVKKPRYTPRWQYSRLLEITAWGGPTLIVVALGYLVWRDTHALDPYRRLVSNQPALRVQVIGYDWKWLFIYPEQGIASIGEFALPVGRPVTLQLTSATVMQSLFIPALGSQIYAMGGMVTQLNLEAEHPGRSLGENTMYSGDGFHQEQFTAVAMAPADFKAWIANVRAHGIYLNATALQAIAQRTTRAQLVAALRETPSSDGGIYFTGVSPAFFKEAVRSTKDGTPLALVDPSSHARAAPGAPKTAAAGTGGRP